MAGPPGVAGREAARARRRCATALPALGERVAQSLRVLKGAVPESCCGELWRELYIAMWTQTSLQVVRW